MSRLTDRFFAVSIVALLALGLVRRMPAAQQAAEPKVTNAPKPAAGNKPGILLEIRGEGIRAMTFSAEDFAKLPRQTVEAKAHDGDVSQYDGVSLIDILSKAGIPTGNELRGKELTRYVIVEASDGYRVLFALPELEPAFTDRVILLADRRDGRRLSDREGPLQIIVPGEKKHARWVRQVTRLVIGRS
jgi:Oxidoreductase molybdopterin binding domain